MLQSLTFRTRLQVSTDPTKRSWAGLEHAQQHTWADPWRSTSKASPTSLLTGLPGCPQNGSVGMRQTTCCCWGRSRETPGPHRGLGLPCVLQVGHIPINRRRLLKTQKPKHVSLLDLVGQSFIPSFHWLS